MGIYLKKGGLCELSNFVTPGNAIIHWPLQELGVGIPTVFFIGFGLLRYYLPFEQSTIYSKVL